MTRIEISICSSALLEYKLLQPGLKTCWHKKINAAMDVILKEVLNDADMKIFFYRKLNVPSLIGHLGTCKINLLVIGKKQSWIINARTSHPRHFVGTGQIIGLEGASINEWQWNRLWMFINRYVAPDAMIRVYCLHNEDTLTKRIALIKKTKGTPFQPPGCSLPNINGICIPKFIDCPIPKQVACSNKLYDLNLARQQIMFSINNQPNNKRSNNKRERKQQQL